MNFCTIEKTLTTAAVYNTDSFDFSTRVDRPVQASSTPSSTKSMELFAQGAVKLLRTMRIHFSIVHKPTQSFEDIRALTRPSPIPAISPLNQTIYSTPPRHSTYLRRVKTTTSTFQHPKNISFSNREIFNTKSLRTRIRPIWASKTSRGSDSHVICAGRWLTRALFITVRWTSRLPKHNT